MRGRYADLTDFDPADFEPDGPCDGSGELALPCRGNHRYPCGGDECADEYGECPGCETCEPTTKENHR